MNFRTLFGLNSLFLLLFLFSCEEYEDLVGYKEYLIEQGEHSSKASKVALLGKTILTYDVIFDKTAIYTLNESDQGDYNKLFGFSDCNDHHHNNSARYGWRWFNDSLEIAAYTYVNEKRIIKPITNFEFDKPYRCIIGIEEDSYFFLIEGVTNPIRMERNSNCNKGIHYQLFPYFGGNNTAPHDISIYLREIY